MSKNKQTLNNVKLVDDIVSGDQALSYDNSTSGLTATNIQSAVDEVQSNKVENTSNQALSTDGNVLYAESNQLKLKRANGDIDSVDLSLYLDDTNLSKITSGSVDGNGLATFTRDDASTFTVDFSVLFDDTNLSRITSASFNSGTGVITLTRNDSSVAGTVDIDGRYLPLSGGTITGNIDVSGTVDGRNLSVDGTKLDGIEAGATADQSASEILTAIKTVDGSGSGLDADLLDGLQASQFLRSDADNTGYPLRFGTQLLNFSTGAHTAIPPMSIKLWDNYNNAGAPTAYSTVLDIYGKAGHSHHQFSMYQRDLRFRSAFYGNDNWSDWAKIWNSDNDGSGSGLDADTVDGLQASQFLRSDTDDTTTGSLTVDGVVITDNIRARTNQDLVITCGESFTVLTDATQSDEFIHLAGEQGVKVYASSNNLTSGLNRVTTLIDTSGNMTAGGNITASGDIVSNSDKRLKSDIKPIENALEIVKSLNGKTYIKDEKESIGLIAQEVEEVLPEMVHTANDEMKTKSVNYQNMVAVLIEAVKDQQQQIDELKEQLNGV